MTSESSFRRPIILSSFVFLIVVFGVDILTPRGLAVWSAYALPVLVLSNTLTQPRALQITILTTVLLWIGAFLPLSERGFVPLWVAVLNRSLMTILFFSVYAIGVRNKRSTDRMNELTLMLDRRAKELEVSNKELESFSYSVSHDLQQPLRAIDGFSRILVEEYEAAIPEDARRYLQVVRENSLRMADLIRDLLAFSRLSRQPMKRRTFNLASTVREAMEILQPLADGRNVRLEVKPMPDCRADPALIKQVMQNLLGNALKFTNSRPEAVIEVGAASENGQTVYYVKDNGVGFDMKYVGKIFGVFQRLHDSESYEGTGAGLAIVQRIIHRHGGEIRAEAETDKGAAFYFTLGETAGLKGNDHDDGSTGGDSAG